MSNVRVESVGFRYDSRSKSILENVELDVPSGQLLCVLGRSGSGKSTLLHLLAGLLRPTSGDIIVDGQSVLNVPAHKRQIILLSQKALLFPFTTVAGNVEFSPRLRGQPRKHRKKRVAELLELVGLPGIEERMPDSLSGGEAQRVALARALAADPTVILMDEPFSNLDAPIRSELQRILRDLHERQKLTTVFVTHQLDEAMALGDRIAGLVDGALESVAPPSEIYYRPATTGVARLVGIEHWLEGEWHGSVLSGPWGKIRLDHPPACDGARKVVAAARPEHLSVARFTQTVESDIKSDAGDRHLRDSDTANPESGGLQLGGSEKELSRLVGTVVDVRYRGSHFDVTVKLAGGSRLQTFSDADADVLRLKDRVEVSAGASRWFALEESSVER